MLKLILLNYLSFHDTCVRDYEKATVSDRGLRRRVALDIKIQVLFFPYYFFMLKHFI